MCGIAGLIHRGRSGGIGSQLVSMLQALKHRGPDSTGFALYGQPKDDLMVMRVKFAEQEDFKKSRIAIREKIIDHKRTVDDRLEALGAKVHSDVAATDYAYRYLFSFKGDLQKLADYVEDVEGIEILSIGRGLELIKDLGDAEQVAGLYDLGSFNGTHAIGHTRMATESDVDIRSAHPYWAYPFQDISVVHNGQLTNYWTFRRQLEKRGHRFVSNCDSEVIAVYLADQLDRGSNLEEAMRRSVSELDGVFTYLVATGNQLGMAKDTMAAKPMVLYESDEFIALASEEVAIRSIFPQEIDTSDPYDSEVRVWQA
ncbi:MAG: class II glutamine amidotransferase [Alphaproteobacteria bacterium]|nr:class II glutamine amidotransferase [Alphaproteobacteria bacterium]